MLNKRITRISAIYEFCNDGISNAVYDDESDCSFVYHLYTGLKVQKFSIKFPKHYILFYYSFKVYLPDGEFGEFIEFNIQLDKKGDNLPTLGPRTNIHNFEY